MDSKLLLKEHKKEIKDYEKQNLNRLITSKEIESIIINLPINKSPGLESFTGEFQKTFKNNNSPSLILSKGIRWGGSLPNTFYTRPALP